MVVSQCIVVYHIFSQFLFILLDILDYWLTFEHESIELQENQWHRCGSGYRILFFMLFKLIYTFQAVYDWVRSLSTHPEYFSIRDWNHLTMTRSSLVTDGVYHMVEAEDIASQLEEVAGREED